MKPAAGSAGFSVAMVGVTRRPMQPVAARSSGRAMVRTCEANRVDLISIKTEGSCRRMNGT
jgi:hypothetical protein